MSIVSSCMTVNLQIRMWSGYRLDKAASRTVTTEANADSDVARVNKLLVPKELLSPVQQIVGAARQHLYDNTLPWKDQGDRLLTRKAFPKFIDEHSDYVDRFEAAVEKLIEQYPAAKEAASFRMGTLFNANDYPRVSDLRHRFSLKLEIDSVTEASDFRVKMDKETLADIRADITDAFNERMRNAAMDIWNRLSTTLGHFHERMSEKDPKFRIQTVKNLEEAVEILPLLNFNDDPQLDQIIKDIKHSLLGHTAKELRENDKLRKGIANEAERIVEDMAGIMRAFGGQI